MVRQGWYLPLVKPGSTDPGSLPCANHDSSKGSASCRNEKSDQSEDHLAFTWEGGRYFPADQRKTSGMSNMLVGDRDHDAQIRFALARFLRQMLGLPSPVHLGSKPFAAEAMGHLEAIPAFWG